MRKEVPVGNRIKSKHSRILLVRMAMRQEDANCNVQLIVGIWGR